MSEVHDGFVMKNHLEERLARLEEKTDAMNELTDAKFVTYKALLVGEAEKVALALNAAEKAITKAEIATEKRFDSVNEFRSTLTDQAGTFLSKDVYEGKHEILVSQVQDLKEAQSRQAGIAIGISTAITIMGVLLSIVIRLSGG